MKIDRKTKAQVKTMAKSLPVYFERMGRRRLIHKKDAKEHYNISDEDLKKYKSITTTDKDGAKLINAKVHEKRMLNAIKKDPEKGYRNYLLKMDCMTFEKLNLWDHIKLYFGKHF